MRDRRTCRLDSVHRQRRAGFNGIAAFTGELKAVKRKPHAVK